MIDRRGFIAAVAGGFLAVPLAAGAQQNRVFRVGFLRSGEPPKTWADALQQGMRELGYVDGQNLVIEKRYTDGSLEALPGLAAELTRLKVDVIVGSGSAAALALQGVTKTIPIVFVGVTYPVELGLVPSLAHPGGNITGLATNPADLVGKHLQLLKEVVPSLRRVAVLWEPANPSSPPQVKGAEASAGALGLQLQLLPVNGPDDFAATFHAARGAGGVLLVDSPLFITYRARLVSLARTSRLPAVYGLREFVDAGGLMSYGVLFSDLYERSAAYVDRILKGAKPGDMPVEQPTKYELVINAREAKELGLTLPRELLLRADEVIR